MRSVYFLVLAVSLSSMPASASVVEYNNNRSAWLAAAGSHTRIDFTGFAPNTIITNQYSTLGVTFTDGTDRIIFNPGSLPNDQWGLYGAINEITLSFASPQSSIAVDFPGTVKFRLYWQGRLSYSSSDFLHVGTGFFAGLISDEPFDAAEIIDPTGNVNIDDLYFGPPVPGPGVWPALLVGSAATAFGRRRRA